MFMNTILNSEVTSILTNFYKDRKFSRIEDIFKHNLETYYRVKQWFLLDNDTNYLHNVPVVERNNDSESKEKLLRVPLEKHQPEFLDAWSLTIMMKHYLLLVISLRFIAVQLADVDIGKSLRGPASVSPSLSKCICENADFFAISNDIFYSKMTSSDDIDDLLLKDLETKLGCKVLVRGLTGKWTKEIQAKTFIIHIEDSKNWKHDIQLFASYMFPSPTSKVLILYTAVSSSAKNVISQIIKIMLQNNIIHTKVVATDPEDPSNFNIYSWSFKSKRFCNVSFVNIFKMDSCSYGHLKENVMVKRDNYFNKCKLKVTYRDYPPFTIRTVKGMIGIEAGILKMLAEKINVILKYKYSNESLGWIMKNGVLGQAQFLIEGLIDILVGAILVDKELCTSVDCSYPYRLRGAYTWCVPNTSQKIGIGIIILYVDWKFGSFSSYCSRTELFLYLYSAQRTKVTAMYQISSLEAWDYTGCRLGRVPKGWWARVKQWHLIDSTSKFLQNVPVDIIKQKWKQSSNATEGLLNVMTKPMSYCLLDSQKDYLLESVPELKKNRHKILCLSGESTYVSVSILFRKGLVGDKVELTLQQIVDHGFIVKWQNEYRSMASFTRLDECLKGAANKVDILQHLRCRAEGLSMHYDPESPSRRLTRNPFTVNGLQLRNNIQEEFLDFKADSTVKDDFQLPTLEQFWPKIYNKINPWVAEGPLSQSRPLSPRLIALSPQNSLETHFLTLMELARYKLLPLHPPLFTPEFVIVNEFGTLLVVAGPCGVLVLQLPERCPPYGAFDNNKEVVYCSSSFMG
nr:unnamed protein product [Callosobruchus analis]